jgi:hypothetical protein
VKGSIKTIVLQPKYVDANEWLALNEFEFFQHLNQFYGVIAEVCTNRNCPSMTAGPGMDYMWIDNQKKQVRLPAPQYTGLSRLCCITDHTRFHHDEYIESNLKREVLPHET